MAVEIRKSICWGCWTRCGMSFVNTKQIHKALTSPNLNLLAVMEQWMIPTAALADYMLPAANWLEMPLLQLGTLSV